MITRLIKPQQEIVDRLYNDIVENGKLTNHTIFIARLPGKTTIIKALNNKLQMRYAKHTTNTRTNRDRVQRSTSTPTGGKGTT